MAAATIYYPTLQNGLQKSLAAALNTGVTASMTLNNTTNVQNKPGVVVVDRIDSSGTLKSTSVREFIAYAGTSGATLTTLTRNVDNSSSDQDHAIGAIVEFIMDVTWAQSVIDMLAGTKSGVTLLTPSLSSPTVTGTETSPKIQGATSNAQFPAVIGEYDNGNSGTSKDIDWSKGDRQLVTMTGNCTFTYSNAVAGQVLTLRVVEDGTGGHSVTLPTSLWPGGSAGTFTTTASAINLLIVYFDGTNYLTQLSANFS